jgi:hypothetical protein
MRVMICHDRPIGLCCDDKAEQVITNRHEDIRFTVSNANTLGCVCFIRAGDTGCGGGRVYRRNTLQGSECRTER